MPRATGSHGRGLDETRDTAIGFRRLLLVFITVCSWIEYPEQLIEAPRTQRARQYSEHRATEGEFSHCPYKADRRDHDAPPERTEKRVSYIQQSQCQRALVRVVRKAHLRVRI